jgi:uncharacterized membrane protein YgcG
MKHRTALITAGSIAAVVFAGAIAIGANLGILTVADSRPVGQLSAATVAQTGGATPMQQYAGVAAVGVNKTADAQQYIIKKAGSVKVAFSKKNVRLVDVTARQHWTWKLTQTGDKKLTVTFTRGSDTYTFVAAVGDQGKLTAKVDHPITKITPAASSGSSAQWVATPVPSSSSPSHEGGDEGGGSYGGGGADD